MFFYVLLYKSILLGMLSLVALAFLIVFYILFKAIPKWKFLSVLKQFFSDILFWNLPLRYIQIVLLDLFISAFMTIWNLIRYDAESDIVFVNWTIDRYLSLTLACIFLVIIFSILAYIVCYVWNWRKMPLRSLSKWIGTFTSGMKNNRIKSYAFYYFLFIIIWMLLAIDVTLVGIVNSKALAIIFLLLVIPSFVFSFRRVFICRWKIKRKETFLDV